MKMENMTVSKISQISYLKVERDGFFTAHNIDDTAGLAMSGRNCAFIYLKKQALRALLDELTDENLMLLVTFNSNSDTGEAGEGKQASAEGKE